MKRLKAILAQMQANYIRNRTFRVLSRLSDHELRDLGYERHTLWSTIDSAR